MFQLNDESDEDADFKDNQNFIEKLDNFVDSKLSIKQLNIGDNHENFEFFQPHKKSMMKKVVSTMKQK